MIMTQRFEPDHVARGLVTIVALACLFAFSSMAFAGSSAVRYHAVPSSCAAPIFPISSARFGEPPSTVFDFRIDAKGIVRESRIIRTSGAREFDEAARVALIRCVYTPLIVEGRPKGGWLRVHYQWVME